jgi:hypothetical protein
MQSAKLAISISKLKSRINPINPCLPAGRQLAVAVALRQAQGWQLAVAVTVLNPNYFGVLRELCVSAVKKRS